VSKLLLFQFPRAWDLPNLSPFCMKVENYLRMTGVPFKTKTVLDPGRAPKGKLPYIEDEAGDSVCDSQHIIEHLKRRRGDSLDESLSLEEHALGHAIRRLCEESLYFPTLYSRWIDPPGWSALRAEVFSKLPPILRNVVPPIARRKVREQLQQQGIGRHNREQIYSLGRDDLDALSGLLGDKSYVLGDEPTSYDATLYAFLASNLRPPTHTPLKVHLVSKKNLVAYCERMHERYYAD